MQTNFLNYNKIQSEVKWPNDILINQHKVGGVLCNKYKEYFMISVGLNLISHPINTLNFEATNLKDELFKINSNNNFFNIFEENTIKNVNNNYIKDFLQNITINIGERIDKYLINLQTFGFNTIKKEWLQFAFLLNEKIILKNF